MFRIILILLIVFHLKINLIGQIQLYVDGIGELATIQSDLSQGEGSMIELRRGMISPVLQNSPLGYLGVHPLRPDDIEFGARAFGHVTFSFLNIPRFRIDSGGRVILTSMIGSNFGQVYASPEGKISKLVGEQVYTAHFAQFRPTDVDGEFVKIVQPIDEVEFVKHQNDIGELTAPLKLPEGAIITKLKVYYINEAPITNPIDTFKVCIERATSDASNIIQDRSPWLDLPKGGGLFLEFDYVSIASIEQEVAPIKIDYAGSYYNVIVRCKDCSEQYIRAVDIIYKF